MNAPGTPRARPSGRLQHSTFILSLAVLSLAAAAAGPPMQRIAGADRFETAVRLSEARFDTRPEPGAVVHITTGEDFPDALMAGPYVAGQHNAVLLPVTRDAIPASVDAELRRLNPVSITIIGGPAAVSTQVEQLLGR